MTAPATLNPRVSLLLLLATACGDAVSSLPERTSLGADDVSGLVTPSEATGIAGIGSLGTGPATRGGNRQDFDFDVGSSLVGRVFFRDWNVIRPDGSVGTLIVDPADAATRISAYRDASTICEDRTHGVELDGIGRVNTGGDSDPAGDELLGFTLRACDDGPAESGLDLISMAVPGHQYLVGPDRLSSGDIVKSSESAPPPPPPGTGNLTVTTATKGSGAPTGYTLSVSGPGGSATQLIGADATVTFSAVAAGDYSVTLGDVPGNCTVSDGASRTVTVPEGGTGTVFYSVSCRHRLAVVSTHATPVA